MLAIYIHWPFCRSKCAYCDFNSHAAANIETARWQRALLAELGWWAQRCGGQPVSSIFFGGGTPSLMPPALVAALLEAIAAVWPLAADCEITLEANPTSVEAGRFQELRAAGVNRLSLGVQALEAGALRFLGRQHSVEEALAALALAARVFPRWSLDLIYARPQQTIAAWQAELHQVLALAPEHLSLYQLSLAPGTALYTAWRAGAFALPDEESAATLFEVTQDILSAAGLPAYEISNHARPGAGCRHNLSYWRYQDYLGIGPGAHGRLTLPDGEKQALQTQATPAVWLQQVEQAGHGGLVPETLTAAARGTEMLLMGLRLSEGVMLARLEAESGQPLETLVSATALARLEGGGFLTRSPTHLTATIAGRQCLNAVLAALLAA